MPIEPKNYLLPGRKGKIKLGFENEYLNSFSGYSDMPDTTRADKRTKIHFEDETYRLANYKLSGGQLQLGIRVDRYIWGILDDVYADYFKVIASCDTDEIFNGGTKELVNHRGGDGAIKVQSTNGAEATASLSISLNGSSI